MIGCKCGEWDKNDFCVKCGNHYTDKWDELLAEIESMRQDKEHLLAVCEERRLAEKEWKRRLHEYKDMLESLPGSVLAPGDGILPQPLESISYHEAIRRKYPEVDDWFEEEWWTVTR